MEEHPIIFNSEMVRAILDGRKTQTRRVTGLKVINTMPDNWRSLGTNWMRRFLFEIPNDDVDKEKSFACSCPYGVVGDVLWVRETWRQIGAKNIIGHIRYKADVQPFETCMYKWRSPYHFPKWACRLFFEITAIKVERVQDISEEDIWAEGIHITGRGCTERSWTQFGILWDSINAKRGYGWDKNPWVWVVEFKRAGDRK